MTELIALEAENKRLRLRVLTAAGDDLCRLTPEEIKAYTSGAVQIPPEEEFIPSCRQFHRQIADTAGVLDNCLTLAQMIAENERLRAACEMVLKRWTFDNYQQHTHSWHDRSDCFDVIRTALLDHTTPEAR